jgi:hypothetical protein
MNDAESARIMLDGIRRNGGRVIVTKRPLECLTLYTRSDGRLLDKDIVTDCIAKGFLIPDDGGLFGDDPSYYRIAY